MSLVAAWLDWWNLHAVHITFGCLNFHKQTNKQTHTRNSQIVRYRMLLFILFLSFFPSIFYLYARFFICYYHAIELAVSHFALTFLAVVVCRWESCAEPVQIINSKIYKYSSCLPASKKYLRFFLTLKTQLSTLVAMSLFTNTICRFLMLIPPSSVFFLCFATITIFALTLTQ